MPELHITEIAEALKGEIFNAPSDGKDTRFVHYHFDTRAVTAGNTLFFAFKSESGDGHRFLPQLQERGFEVIAAVVAKDYVPPPEVRIPLIRVEDPLKAAQTLAGYVRDTYRHVKYVGVTGSAGKTTTKEFVYRLLSLKYRAYRSFKNWNNWIGVPFSLLNMKGDEEAAVFELAMSYPGIGEIDLLARILRPDAAVVLNAYPVHLEFLKTVENVASAKSEILNYLSADDMAFINGDLDHLLEKTDAKAGRKIRLGKKEGNDIRLKEIKREGERTIIVGEFYGVEARFETPIVNRLQVENLFMAIVVVQHLGMKHVEIQEALKNIKPLAGRGQIRNSQGFTIIDETYNSNPEAVKRTMDWINREYSREKIAVLGDMLELGENEAAFHAGVGGAFATLDFQRLITVGERAEKIKEGALKAGFAADRISAFKTALEAGEYLAEVAPADSVVLFKASRGIALEIALDEFLKRKDYAEKVFRNNDVLESFKPGGIANTAVAGFGKSGRALLDFILMRNMDTALFLYNDTPLETETLSALQKDYEARGVTFLIGKEQFGKLEEMDLILFSPGVDGNEERFQRLRDKGIVFASEIEFAARFIDAPIIAITGTNGKSTTVSLIHHFLNKNGFKSFLTGNIGTPLISEVENIAAAADSNPAVVVEVSSFQLEEIKAFKPHVAAILNITPDHLNRYGTMAKYMSAKFNLASNQDSCDYLVLNAADGLLEKQAAHMGCAGKVKFALKPGKTATPGIDGSHIDGTCIRLRLGETVETISLEKNPLMGLHNLENLQAAALAVRVMGVTAAGIEAAMEDFKGLTHRMEQAGTIGNVTFINDSKATNIDATLKSISSIDGNLVLLLGGKDKGGDFTILEKPVKENAFHVLLVGDASQTIHDQLKNVGDKFTFTTDFADALEKGYGMLKEIGGTVLLAPGCASFDMFDNFEHRGEVFKQEVVKLRERVGGGGNG